MPLGLGGETLLGVASAAIDDGDLITVAANGKVREIPVASGTYYVIGRALTSAANDGDYIEFVACVPYAVVVE
jgi:hypothetical protein